MTSPSRRSILVGVDFSDASAGAITLAGALAMALDARLTAMHAEVLEAPAYFTHEQLDALEAQRAEARHAAAEFLARFVGERSSVAVEPLVVDEPPAEAILHASTAADRVVMGTHGRRGPSRWWLGSVAERVVRAATVPVLVVQGHAALTEPSTVFGKILLAAAHGAAADRARGWADLLAAAFDGAVEDAGTLDTCSSDRIGSASLLVLAVPEPGIDRTIGGLETAVLRTCGRPVLFVPAAS